MRRSMLRFSRIVASALNQLLQIIQVRALLLRGGPGGQGLVVATDVVQVQSMQPRCRPIASRSLGVMIVYLVGVEVRGSDVDIEQVVSTSELQGSAFKQRRARVSRMLVMYSAP